MAIALANLQLKRVIVHEVLLASDLDGGRIPRESEVFVELDPKGHELLCKRLVDSLGSDSHSVELEVELDQEGSAFDLISSLLDEKDAEFVRKSKRLGAMLTSAQSAGSIKAGICLVLDGTVGSGAELRRLVAVLKAEPDAAFVKDITQKAVNLKYVTDMVLGAQQRLYKVGCFIEKTHQEKKHDEARLKSDFEAVVYDHQMSSTADSKAARYFYAAFLGCRLADSAPRLTKVFYDATTEFINQSPLPAQTKLEWKNALVAYLKSQEALISTRKFAETFLPKRYHKDFFRRVHAAGFPNRNVAKDNRHIQGKLRIRRMLFSSKVRISAPEDDFENLVRIVDERQTIEHRDGWTIVQINGTLESQT